MQERYQNRYRVQYKKFFLLLVSDALFIAGIRTLLVGIVVIKIQNAKAVVKMLTLKLNKTIRADITKT
mgnify:CR=1 FL=1